MFAGNIAYLLLGGGVFHALERKKEEERHQAAWLSYQAFLGRLQPLYPSNISSQYIEVWVKWPTFCRRRFQMHSVYDKCCILI